MVNEKKTTDKEETKISEEQMHSAEETSTGEHHTQDTNSNKFLKEEFPIVGVGASAGGLAAFEAFFSAIPYDTKLGMAFVLVQHLDPTHRSLLSDLIGRYTQMPVYEVKDGMLVQPDCIYVIPPNHDMVLEYGALQLQEPAEPRGHHLPIDLFFRSLAQNKQEMAIGIILSGTGSDGTLGIQAIKTEGGMVMVQSPESSEYDGMPRSSIATGLADYILTPAEMPSQLIAYVNQVFGKRPQVVPSAKDSMKKIFNILYTQTGHDFSHYKQTTINRRIERRMAIQNVKSTDEYVNHLEKKPGEVEALFHDFLIGVTSFFRNPSAYEVFQKKVIRNLFTGKHPESTIRIWVPGCSTGEEAYSIGILLQEQMEALKQVFKVQIFATDIDRKAIEKARSGVYPATISIDISPERLERFFTMDSGGNYHIQKSIRNMMIFSEQDIIKDPPFSRLDLLSCRNVLIYMDKELQKKLIPLFHYALKPGGCLFLGPSETVGELESLFNTLDRKSKLYRKKDVSSGLLPMGMFIPSRLESKEMKRPSGKVPVESKTHLRGLTEQTMLQYYAPVGVLVNETGDILYIHGRTGMYLEPAPGEAGLNILKMAREGLQQKLTMALHDAVTRKEPVFLSGLRVKTNGDFTTVNLALRPVAEGSDAAVGPNLFLITFEELPDWAQIQTVKSPTINADEGACDNSMEVDARILELKRELQAKEERIRAYSEELETSNEELKSSNEEMQSINEELQSTNEELETSKEELQSVNEELTTVNTELQNKVADLSQAINDMNNLMAGTDIGTIFVDYQLRIVRFTPAVTQVINLIPTDVGRPVGHIVSNLLGYDRLIEDIKEVLDSLTPKDIEVQSRKGTWYLLRIRPYRTLENVIKGAVITFTDITEVKRAREILKESEAMRRLAAIVRDTNDAVTLQDIGGNILAWNPMAEKMYGWSEAEALTMNISRLVPESRKEEEVKVLKRLSQAETLEPYRTKRLTKRGLIMEVWLTATSLANEAGEVYAIATTEREIKSKYKKESGHD
ncbi:chemotaxis protein CheR [Methanosarcina mazei]|uniref:protein-glutamate O-methyltransferase n=1 Tax=Methanosarcina mazei TaxID=2209 RepID=A0A0F8R4R7_METMZ|nr:chemotaxis protein CheB [Methanosarcina mazei]KKH72705.1 chemotaxis protein CheR [Methanosarcina mazei]